MKYGQVVHGRLLKRVNRFIAKVFVDGEVTEAHVKNTGRLKELLQPDAELILERSNNPNRKTRFSLIAVAKHGRWVNIDSQAPNWLASRALQEGKLSEIGPVNTVKREVTYGDSRFDLYYEQDDLKGFIEVKGVTLEKEGMAMFPDAPTARGTKHVYELAKAVEEGYQGTILFIVQMKGCQAFTPNREMDAAFADAIVQAKHHGVQLLAYDSIVTEDELILGEPIPILV